VGGQSENWPPTVIARDMCQIGGNASHSECPDGNFSQNLRFREWGADRCIAFGNPAGRILNQRKGHYIS